MNGAQMFRAFVSTAWDVVAAGFMAAPITWSLLIATIIAFGGCAYQIAEHQGWRASGWALVGAGLLALFLAMTPHAAEALS